MDWTTVKRFTDNECSIFIKKNMTISSVKLNSWIRTWIFCAFTRPDWQAEALCLQLSIHSLVRSFVCPFMHLSICQSVNKLVNTLRTDWSWCKLAQVVGRVRAWNGQLSGSGGQRQRSGDTKIGHKNPCGEILYLKSYGTNFNQT